MSETDRGSAKVAKQNWSWQQSIQTDNGFVNVRQKQTIEEVRAALNYLSYLFVSSLIEQYQTDQLNQGLFIWQDSASAFFVSKSDVDKVCKYILNQPALQESQFYRGIRSFFEALSENIEMEK